MMRVTLDPGAALPVAAHTTDVGADLTVIKVLNVSHNITYFGTGVHIYPSPGYHVEVYARSSLHQTGWALANGVGIIDPTYNDQIILALVPISPAYISAVDMIGRRVAQIVLRSTVTPKVEISRQSSLTTSREGFGSTGQ
jgi:dUTPase